ncbi:MAG: ABC transporter permease subunit [Candidatus Limnocylindrales bacterium]|jgi:ABC-2 type transport system permease protein
MATQVGSPPLGVRAAPALWSRFYGLGSIYAKTLRDSRRAFIIVAALMGGLMLVLGAAIPMDYSTQKARDDMARLATDLGAAAAGLAGKPINVGTLGGYVQWKYGPVYLLIASLWSILALSGTLATEARRGSLEFVAASPFGKRRIALEKLAAHLTVMTVALAILAFAAWLAGAAFGNLPGDEIPPQAAVGFALWIGLVALAFGGLAFALAPLIGRSAAAGIAGFVLVAGWILNGYQGLVPALAVPADLTPWAWTASHLPLAGQYDWVSLVPVAVVAVVLLAVGIEAFGRRDVGASNSVRTPGLPAPTLGLRGPVSRAFGERLPLALAWGLGLGAFGLVMAAASRSLADEFARMSPDTVKVFRDLFPNFDMASAGSLLQLLVQLEFIAAGFAAATLVAGWASDETSGRLEMLLSTPLARSRWAIRSGIGVFAAIGSMTAVLAVAIGIGAALAGSEAVTPMAGSVSLGLYAAALAGVGFAVGGILRTSIAAEIVALLAAATYLVDLIAPALKLPEAVHHLALSADMGQPMIGHWDPAGIAACLVLAVAGLALGGWGVRRRDVAS